ncbi:MAG: peptide-methionine (S)-S-oxide reductase MsrA [Negativicutes bacterium]|nr:peptide-methionine (S)-S-oxide reductase MsrA [Negativicutes bacterium]
MKKIWLAGGCYWGVEAYFSQLKGVLATRVGFGQGRSEKPTYEQVCAGTTGHAEICEVTYDSAQLPLPELLEHFFRIIDPTTLNRQGPDRGSQYRTGVYYSDEAERKIILGFIANKQEKYTQPIVVEVEAYQSFYPAEEYHQKYLQKNPGGYCHIDLGLAKPEERK